MISLTFLGASQVEQKVIFAIHFRIEFWCARDMKKEHLCEKQHDFQTMTQPLNRTPNIRKADEALQCVK